MNKIIKYLFILINIFCLAILGWAEYPYGQYEKTFTINTSLLPKNNKLEKCSLYGDLLSSNFVINFPKSIARGESGEITLSIIKTPVLGRFIQSKGSENDCEIKLEVWIDIMDFQIIPTGRNFELFNESPNQDFIFSFSSLVPGKGTGRIWIFDNVELGEEDELLRDPLFSIPFEIWIKSIFGLSTKLFEWLCLVALFFLDVIWIRLRVKEEGNDIIVNHGCKTGKN